MNTNKCLFHCSSHISQRGPPPRMYFLISLQKAPLADTGRGCGILWLSSYAGVFSVLIAWTSTTRKNLKGTLEGNDTFDFKLLFPTSDFSCISKLTMLVFVEWLVCIISQTSCCFGKATPPWSPSQWWQFFLLSRPF